MVRFLWLLAVLGACSDGVHIEVDGGADMTTAETRSLELLGEARLTLRDGDEALVEARLVDELGAPIPSETVRFVLDGTANDTSLDTLEARTDENGIARTRIIAGSTASAFRLRISADDAAPVFVNVGVSDRGFGRLVVNPIYSGTRAGRLGASVFVEASCEDELAGDGRYREAGSEGAAFVGIPAGVPLAVVGRLDGDGVVLASQCLDGVILEADAESAVQLELEDAPAEAEGVYDARLGIEGSALANALGDALAALEFDLAARFLDLAEAHLERGEQVDALRDLQTARSAGLDLTLRAEFQTTGVSREALNERVRNSALPALIEVSVYGELRLGAQSTLATREVRVGEEERLLVEGRVRGATELVAEIEEDELIVERLAIELSGGNLVRAILLETATLRGFEDAAVWLGAPLECGIVSIPGCDDLCVQNACSEVAASYTGELDAALEMLDVEFPELEVSGSVSLEDISGDLSADVALGELNGFWGDSEAEVSFAGERRVLTI